MGENQSELARVMVWMVSKDTGLSSTTIAVAMCGISHSNPYTPSDPDDLGRCLRLLVKFPEWQGSRFRQTMSKISHEWAVFSEDWDRLAASMAEEVGIDWSKGRSAPITYNLMKETERRALETDPDIIITGRSADGSPCAWKRRPIPAGSDGHG